MPPTTGQPRPPPQPPGALIQHQMMYQAAGQAGFGLAPGMVPGAPGGTPAQATSGRSTTPHYSHFCGVPSNKGLPCKRPVTRAGEKCLYHREGGIGRSSLAGAPKAEPGTPVATEAAETPAPAKRGRGRPPKNAGLKGDKNAMCAECGNDTAPTRLETDKSEEPMPNLMLKCSIDKNYWHAYCAEASTPPMIAKVVTYPWECSDCK